MHESARAAVREAGVSYHDDVAACDRAARDFGGIAAGRTLLVAEPSSADEASRLFTSLASRGVGCTLRGAGFGQSGQSVAVDTVSLATKRLDKVGSVDFDSRTIRVGAGASFRRVLDALRGSGLAPPVVPLNLDMSIGGLVSAGGVGPTSHRRGFVADNVVEAEVVTPDGEIRRTSASRLPELFGAVLGGVGQCGLLTRLVLDLTFAPRTMRVLSFFYDDVHAFIEDQRAITRISSEIHLEGFCWASARGVRPSPSGPVPYTHWTYGLSVSFDDLVSSRVEVDALLDSLRATRKLDDHRVEFANYLCRYDARFAAMVSSGAWNEPHPWFEGVVPFDRVAELLPELLAMLPAEVGDGHRLMLVDTRRSPAILGRPPGELAALLGIFPVAFAKNDKEKVLTLFDDLTRMLVERGGRRYLSGWLGPDGASYLRAHHGDRFDEWLGARRRFDPAGTLRSALLPRGHRD